MSIFEDYRNHKIITLSREIGEPINCFHDTNGLPNKVIHFPVARDVFPGQEDEPADPRITMRLVAPDGGRKLKTYLIEALGLTEGVDFHRHGNGYRGGLLYFDILTENAVNSLIARADAKGAASAVEREQNRPAPSPWTGRSS